MTAVAEALKLDLACGQNKMPGFVGVDISPAEGVDVVANLFEFPWPFDDESVGEVFCSHFLEHVPDVLRFGDELWRVMEPGAKARIVCPYYTSARAFQDPTHKQRISEFTFLYWNAGWRKQNRLDHYPVKADFDFSYDFLLDPAWAARSPDTLQFAIRHYWNVVSDISVTLSKVR